MSHNSNVEGSETGNSVQITKSDLLEQQVHRTEHSTYGQGALSSLWQDAYENPVKTGLAVTAAVGLGAALVYASKGRIADRFMNAKPGVLIIEDTPAMGMAMRDTLKASGHEVTWVTGISKLNPLTAVDATGAEISIAGNKRFKVALLDGDLGKDMLTGPEIVSSLKRENIVTIGTSTVPRYNIEMQANGAEMIAPNQLSSPHSWPIKLISARQFALLKKCKLALMHYRLPSVLRRFSH